MAKNKLQYMTYACNNRSQKKYSQGVQEWLWRQEGTVKQEMDEQRKWKRVHREVEGGSYTGRGMAEGGNLGRETWKGRDQWGNWREVEDQLNTDVVSEEDLTCLKPIEGLTLVAVG